jgi:hypothetical protein
MKWKAKSRGAVHRRHARHAPRQHGIPFVGPAYRRDLLAIVL